MLVQLQLGVPFMDDRFFDDLEPLTSAEAEVLYPGNGAADHLRSRAYLSDFLMVLDGQERLGLAGVSWIRAVNGRIPAASAVVWYTPDQPGPTSNWTGYQSMWAPLPDRFIPFIEKEKPAKK